MEETNACANEADLRMDTRWRLRKACVGANLMSSLTAKVTGEEIQHTNEGPMLARRLAHVHSREAWAVPLNAMSQAKSRRAAGSC